MPSSEPLRVMSFNIRTGRALDGPNRWSRRRRLVFDTIRSSGAHVAGLQEVLDFQLAELTDALPEYRAVGRGRDAGRGGEHVPILVDARRLEVLDHGDFWLSETPDAPGSVGWDAALPRIATWALLRDGDGSRFAVFNVHLDHRGERARAQGAALLGSRAAGLDVPRIIVGDLNAGERSEPVRTLLAAGWRDVQREITPSADLPTYHGFGRGPGGRIDYILCDRAWRILGAEVLDVRRDGRFPSDHHPVVADLAGTMARDS